MIGFSSGHVSDRAWTRAGPPTSPPRPPAQSSSLPAPATSCSPWPPPWLPGDEVLILRHWRVDFFCRYRLICSFIIGIKQKLAWFRACYFLLAFWCCWSCQKWIKTKKRHQPESIFSNIFVTIETQLNWQFKWSSENTEKLEKLCKFSYFLFTLSNMSLVAGFNQVTKLAAGSTNWIFWLSG